ncbi:MAG: hypothetical protein SFX72_15560 [Isosphaeraceae bacterium]|nr:hypothetical protein [Isosphaeraceae bacterium]
MMAWAALVVLAAWFVWDDWETYSLFGDDFIYISEALDRDRLLSHLMEPHNTHIVPLFRLWTWLWTSAAGSLSGLVDAFRAASFFALAAAAGLVALLVRRETGRSWVTFVAAVLLVFGSALPPSVRWYSAGQALWAGTAITATLLAAQSWRRRPGVLRGVVLLATAATAPTIWTGGHLAGPAAAMYLLVREGDAATNPQRPRRLLLMAAGLCALSVVEVAVELVLVRGEMERTAIIWERHGELWPRPIQGVLHTFRAIAEESLLGNLGVDAELTEFQAVALTAGVLGIWWWATRGRGPNGLEAAGATMVIGCYLMTYWFRGNLPYESLRPVRWYHAVPQVGVVICAAGVLARAAVWRGSGEAGSRLSRAGLAGILAFAAVWAGLHLPRFERDWMEAAAPMTALEQQQFATSEMRYLRAVYLAEATRTRQIRHLRRLEQAERIAANSGVGVDSLRRAFGRVLVPGIPEKQKSSDAFDLLRLPAESRPRPGISEVLTELEHLVVEEPMRPPPWATPGGAMPGS